MADWDLYGGGEGCIMTQTPVEDVEDYLQADASLVAISQVLEHEWQVARQINSDSEE